MAVAYNADEVFKMGVEIEKNGRDFYNAAADASEDEDVKKFFVDLAEWENNHVTLFESLRKESAAAGDEDNLFDPEHEMQKYLKAAAESHIFLKTIDIPKLVKDCDTAIDVLNIAIQFEKDSVVLYNSMIEMVSQNLGKENIDKLIREELKHVAMLQEMIEQLST